MTLGEVHLMSGLATPEHGYKEYVDSIIALFACFPRENAGS